MLRRVRSFGSRALANAEYGKNFTAIRHCSVEDGSLFEFKCLPEKSYGGLRGRYRPTHPVYTCWIFGYADAVVSSDFGPYIRIKCPPDAACSIVKAYALQMGLLGNILSQDLSDLGGSIKLSWFDCTSVGPNLPEIPDSFYIKGDDTQCVKLCEQFAKISREFLMEVSIHRVDHDTVPVGERSYWLEVVKTDIYPRGAFPCKRRDVRQYVCDVNGSIGCQLCV